MRLRLSILAVTCCCVLTACVTGGADPVERDDLRNLVLQREDLPKAFLEFSSGPVRSSEAPPDGAWQAGYRRPGTRDTRGPLVVSTRVDLFPDGAAAGKDLDETRAELEGDGARPLQVPTIGETGFGVRIREQAVQPVDLFVLAWRESNVTARVTVSGFATRISLADALALARKQERRIDAALGS